MTMIVERERELTDLRGLHADSAAGRGRVALVSGGLAGGARAERDMPLGIMWQLFRGAALPPGFFERVSALVPWDSPGATTPSAVDGRAVHGMCALLLELADQQPLVVLVDDVQHVDEASLQVLVGLRRRIRAAPVLLVVAEWERPTLARPAPLAELTRQPDRRIALTTLSSAGVAELVRRRLDSPAGPAAELFDIAGGNPLLTNALIEDLLLRGGTDVPGGFAEDLLVGAVFRQDTLDCLRRWDADVSSVALAVAVLDRHAGADLLGRLIDLPDRSVVAVLDVLCAAGLMSGDRLRHADLTAAVLAGAVPEELTRLHLRAAELLYALGVEPVETARHLVAAAAVPGAWAVGLLRQAADQSTADNRFAVACLELALTGCAQEERVALRAALVRVAWRGNPSAVAPQLPSLRVALGAGELSWRDTVPVVRHFLWHGDVAAAVDHLRVARTTLGAPDAHTVAELCFTGEWIYGALPAPARELLADPDRSVTSPLTRTGRLLSGGPEVVAGAEHVLQSGTNDVLPEVGAMAVLALDGADQHERARFCSDALAEEAERRRSTTWRALLGCVRADLAWRRGDLASASAHADSAFDLMHAQSWGVLVGLPLSTQILATTAMGHLTEAAALLDRVVPEAMFGTVFGARYLHASGCHHLAAGRPRAAVDDLERCGELVRGLGLDLPALLPWRGDLAQAYLALGMRKAATELAKAQLDRVGVAAGTRARAKALRVLAAAGALADRVPTLHEVIELLERCGDRLELARALTDLSQAHRELGELGDARLVLRRAEQELKACRAVAGGPRQGASDVADVSTVVRVDTRPVAAPEPVPTGVAALSDAERNVAALAVLGHTNREIGHLLYITVSTVEQHLTRVYRKLNVSRRTDLPADMSRPDPKLVSR
jgi:DNA-binding CsgD family transcriptional regulator